VIPLSEAGQANQILSSLSYFIPASSHLAFGYYLIYLKGVRLRERGYRDYVPLLWGFGADIAQRLLQRLVAGGLISISACEHIDHIPPQSSEELSTPEVATGKGIW
jgi:hypothetical protein